MMEALIYTLLKCSGLLVPLWYESAIKIHWRWGDVAAFGNEKVT